MPTTVVTAPANLPVSVSEVREAVGVEHTDDDVRIARLIAGVVDYLLQHGRVCLTTGLRYTERGEYPFRRQPKRVFLPGPVQSIEAVTITDSEGDDTVLTVQTDYALEAGVLSLYRLAVVRESLSVDFTAGYTDDPEALPAALRAGVLQNVCELYRTPERFVIGQAVNVLPVPDLLSPFIPLSP